MCRMNSMHARVLSSAARTAPPHIAGWMRGTRLLDHPGGGGGNARSHMHAYTHAWRPVYVWSSSFQFINYITTNPFKTPLFVSGMVQMQVHIYGLCQSMKARIRHQQQ